MGKIHRCVPVRQSIDARKKSDVHYVMTVDVALSGEADVYKRQVQDGIPFAQALKGAQANGYAEQNPAADVEGQDTCRKLCILSSIAFGWHLLPEQVPTTGITSITLADEAYACLLYTSSSFW